MQEQVKTLKVPEVLKYVHALVSDKPRQVLTGVILVYLFATLAALVIPVIGSLFGAFISNPKILASLMLVLYFVFGAGIGYFALEFYKTLIQKGDVRLKDVFSSLNFKTYLKVLGVIVLGALIVAGLAWVFVSLIKVTKGAGLLFGLMLTLMTLVWLVAILIVQFAAYAIIVDNMSIKEAVQKAVAVLRFNPRVVLFHVGAAIFAYFLAQTIVFVTQSSLLFLAYKMMSLVDIVPIILITFWMLVVMLGVMLILSLFPVAVYLKATNHDTYEPQKRSCVRFLIVIMAFIAFMYVYVMLISLLK